MVKHDLQKPGFGNNIHKSEGLPPFTAASKEGVKKSWITIFIKLTGVGQHIDCLPGGR